MVGKPRNFIRWCLNTVYILCNQFFSPFFEINSPIYDDVCKYVLNKHENIIFDIPKIFILCIRANIFDSMTLFHSTSYRNRIKFGSNVINLLFRWNFVLSVHALSNISVFFVGVGIRAEEAAKTQLWSR